MGRIEVVLRAGATWNVPLGLFQSYCMDLLLGPVAWTGSDRFCRPAFPWAGGGAVPRDCEGRGRVDCPRGSVLREHREDSQGEYGFGAGSGGHGSLTDPALTLPEVAHRAGMERQGYGRRPGRRNAAQEAAQEGCSCVSAGRQADACGGAVRLRAIIAINGGIHDLRVAFAPRLRRRKRHGGRFLTGSRSPIL